MLKKEQKREEWGAEEGAGGVGGAEEGAGGVGGAERGEGGRVIRWGKGQQREQERE